MQTTQIQPNEIKYFNVKVNDYDITGMVLATDIYQELFSPTWSCQLAFSDTQNLLMNIPIKPGSEVVITMETDYPENSKKTLRFVVYKISDRIQLKQDHQGYVLNCVTKEFFKNQTTRVQQSFKGMNPEKIVGTILKEYGMGELVDSDRDNNPYSIIVPNMSPFAAINWVSRFAKSPNGGADFWFFQTGAGQFKFKSLDKMLTDRSGVKFKQYNPNFMTDDDNINTDHFLNIQSFEFLTQHDAMSNYAAGYYGNTTLTHDIYNKEFKKFTFSYGDDIPADKQYQPFDADRFQNAQNSHVVYQPVSPGALGQDVRTPADTHAQWLGSRKSNVMKMEENRLVMLVPGAVSHVDLLGKQVDVELPSNQDIDQDHRLDKYMKGSYVVTAIRHTIESTSYTITMELGKKRLEEAYD